MVSIKQPIFNLFYESTNITEDIKPYVLEINYSDALEGLSDEIQVVFEDTKENWINSWWPTQGAKLRLEMGYSGGEIVDFGAFEIDEIEYNYPPSVVTLKALSTGISKGNRTLLAKSYENTTLADIIKTVARRSKLNVSGTILHVPIQRVTQYQERNVEFLSRLAWEYNHSFKIVDDLLVFSVMSELKERDPIILLNRQQVISMRFLDKIKDTAKLVKTLSYDTSRKKVIESLKENKGRRPNVPQSTTSSADTLKIITRGDSTAQINARTEAHLEQQNDEQQSAEITLIGDPKLVAGNTLQIENVGMFSGKYLIKNARHQLSRNSGYITVLELKMVEYIKDGANENS